MSHSLVSENRDMLMT